MASITCVKKVINNVLPKIVNKIDMVYILSDGCASQFWSKFVFKLLTLIHPKIGLEWHYNEAHHGKGSMDGIGGTVKNTVFRKVLSGEVVTGSPEEFTWYVNQICQVDSLYLPTAEIPDKLEDVQYLSSISLCRRNFCGFCGFWKICKSLFPQKVRSIVNRKSFFPQNVLVSPNCKSFFS